MIAIFAAGWAVAIGAAIVMLLWALVEADKGRVGRSVAISLVFSAYAVALMVIGVRVAHQHQTCFVSYSYADGKVYQTCNGKTEEIGTVK